MVRCLLPTTPKQCSWTCWAKFMELQWDRVQVRNDSEWMCGSSMSFTNLKTVAKREEVFSALRPSLLNVVREICGGLWTTDEVQALLSKIDFLIPYKEGNLNMHADALPRTTVLEEWSRPLLNDIPRFPQRWDRNTCFIHEKETLNELLLIVPKRKSDTIEAFTAEEIQIEQQHNKFCQSVCKRLGKAHSNCRILFYSTHEDEQNCESQVQIERILHFRTMEKCPNTRRPLAVPVFSALLLLAVHIHQLLRDSSKLHPACTTPMEPRRQ